METTATVQQPEPLPQQHGFSDLYGLAPAFNIIIAVLLGIGVVSKGLKALYSWLKHSDDLKDQRADSEFDLKLNSHHERISTLESNFTRIENRVDNEIHDLRREMRDWFGKIIDLLNTKK